MPPINPTTELRKKIAKSYCRDVLWIDDEINPTAADAAARTPYLQFFQPIADEFASREILCHLKGFPQITGEADPYAPDSPDVEVCQKLALKADVVILDWHLGSQNPQHSARIIREVVRAGGSRFIVVLSEAGELVDEFEREFGADFVRTADSFYRTSEGVFALLFAKADFRANGGAELLIERIFDQLALTYPDYLHWAAIEIASRVKACSPRWLANLPVDTDLAILAENIHSQEDIGAAVIENLLEDLGESMDFPLIESMRAESLGCNDWPKASSYREELARDVTTVEGGIADQIRLIVPFATDATTPLDARPSTLIKKVLRDASHLDSIKKFGESIQALGEFCESRSSSADVDVIRRGSVLKIEGDTEVSPIYVCVSQSCDCLRAESLLFVAATAVPDTHAGRAGETFFRFQKKTYLVSAAASNLKVLSIQNTERLPQGHMIIGRLREISLHRIVSRFWGQTTRVGINQPRFIRESRDEKP